MFFSRGGGVSFSVIFPSISFQNVCRWRARVETLRADVQKRKFRRITVSSRAVNKRSEGWFPEAEQRVFTLFQETRALGISCSTLWFTVVMKEELAKLFPDNSADDFVAGGG